MYVITGNTQPQRKKTEKNVFWIAFGCCSQFLSFSSTSAVAIVPSLLHIALQLQSTKNYTHFYPISNRSIEIRILKVAPYQLESLESVL